MPAQRKSITIDHLCRVEGYGGISVKVENGKIIQSNMNIFEGARFFEAILNGRSYDEVPQIASRVCAICSAVHSLTAIAAIEDAFGTRVSPQTRLLRDLLLQGGTIESHALHLFFLALPDYLGYSGAVELAADHPDHVNLGLALKKLGNSIQELIGGRSVHPVNALIGGFSALPNKAQLEALREDLQEGKRRAERMIALMESITVEEFCNNEPADVKMAPTAVIEKPASAMKLSHIINQLMEIELLLGHHSEKKRDIIIGTVKDPLLEEVIIEKIKQTLKEIRTHY